MSVVRVGGDGPATAAVDAAPGSDPLGLLERARIGGSVVWWGGGFFDVFEGERFQFGDQFSEAAGVVQ